MSFLDDAPIVIAEIGGNHSGDLDLAKEMVRAAVDAGTPYVKFQTYITERLVGQEHPAFGSLREESLSFDEFRELNAFCNEMGGVFLSTPFDLASADLLAELDVPVFKIASGDVTHIPLIRHVSSFGKPVLLSTGASTLVEIDRAVEVLSEGDASFVLLHCVAAYPCPDTEMDLNVIHTLSDRYGCPVGLSDHTAGIDLSFGAVALGAVVLEKHFTTDPALPGGDNDMSILPEELERLVTGVRRIHGSLGSGSHGLTSTEQGVQERMRRSLFAARDLAAGEVLTEGDLVALRPGSGISPGRLQEVLGKRLSAAVTSGMQITEESLA